MIDKNKVRSVVARFFNVPETAVTDEFMFPPERLHGSVGRATFYAAIKRLAGADLPAAKSATTFRQLFETAPDSTPSQQEIVTKSENPSPAAPLSTSTATDVKVGIDVEYCDNLPAYTDPWTESFFAENFTPAEIAYCQRQPDARQTFCGLWCAKEAAIKCLNMSPGLRPAELEIGHDAGGRPFLALLRGSPGQIKCDCEISISHTKGIAVAVCITRATNARSTGFGLSLAADEKVTGQGNNTLAWIALGIGLLNLLVWVFSMVKK
jgi:phosphopantetheine--protein transferase-like protein